MKLPLRGIEYLTILYSKMRAISKELLTYLGRSIKKKIQWKIFDKHIRNRFIPLRWTSLTLRLLCERHPSKEPRRLQEGKHHHRWLRADCRKANNIIVAFKTLSGRKTTSNQMLDQNPRMSPRAGG
ncbi:hypothetical protein BVY04_05485 [bacterium M21]|nr:hypothetical protein BVY04_05485 [bacterium M21]